MSQTIPISLLPLFLIISLCLCFSLLPNLTEAHQTNNANNNDDVFVTHLIEKGACNGLTHKKRHCIDLVTNLIEKACRHYLEKEVCIDGLKLLMAEGSQGLTMLIKRTWKGVSNITTETLDHLKVSIKQTTTEEGESSYKQVLVNCAKNYRVVKENADYYDGSSMISTRVNYVNQEVKSCDQQIRNQSGHSQSLIVNKNSKMIRRLSNFVEVINRLSMITEYGYADFLQYYY